MARLVLPGPQFHASFLEAMAEFADEGRTGDGSMIGTDLARYRREWQTAEGFDRYLTHLLAQCIEDAPRPTGHVPSTTWWWVDTDSAGAPRYLGRIVVRHRITGRLRDVGGHIGYDVRRSARRRGHATAMLQAVLPKAHALGIDPALITCDRDNVGSRAVIERAGGVPDAPFGRVLRFWVPTH